MFEEFLMGLNATITHLIVITGLVLTVAGLFTRFISFIPSIGAYAQAIKVVGIVLLALGVYMEGRLERDTYWHEKLQTAQKEAELKIQEKDNEIEKLNKSLEEKVKVKVITITKTQYANRNTIVENERTINTECKVAPVAVQIHNAAAQNKEFSK